MTDFWRQWLRAASLITAGIGGLLALLAVTGLPPALFDILYLPGEPDVVSADTLSLAIGVAGAVMAGWGVMLATAFRTLGSDAAVTTARALGFGLIVWFVLDSVASAVNGASMNVVVNVLFLAMFAPPLIAVRPSKAV